MQSKALGKNLVMVAFSRLVSLVSSVFAGFLLPKMFNVTDYGFYKVFTLYAVYTALLHFGFVDGILLKMAGKDYRELELPRMRTYTRFFVIFETIISGIMIIVGIIFASGDYLFIVFMLAINMVFVNLTTYYQFVSQAVQRFGEYSAKSLIISVVKILFVSGLFVLYFYNIAEVSYKIYLIGLNILDLSILLWYVYIYRDITFGKAERVRTLKKEIVSIFKTGIVLTLAYQVTHLVLALDRQFVNILFSTETFAFYSFAYNIVSLISTMISSLSVVLLPMLRKSAKEVIVESYRTSTVTVAVTASAGLLCYFPLAAFIMWFLPNYNGSLEYITIVLPAFLFTSVITVVMFTIAKVLDISFDFFKDSCAVLVLGFLANAVAYGFCRSPKSISYASFIVAAIWYIIADVRLRKKTKVIMYKEFIYLLVISLGFLIVTNFIDGIIMGFVAYGVWLIMWTTIFYFAMLKQFFSTVVKKLVHH